MRELLYSLCISVLLSLLIGQVASSRLLRVGSPPSIISPDCGPVDGTTGLPVSGNTACYSLGGGPANAATGGSGSNCLVNNYGNWCSTNIYAPAGTGAGLTAGIYNFTLNGKPVQYSGLNQIQHNGNFFFEVVPDLNIWWYQNYRANGYFCCSPTFVDPFFTGTGYISGATLTVATANAGGHNLTVGTFINMPGVIPGTQITAFGSGSGTTGTYTVSPSQSIGSSGSPVAITTAPIAPSGVVGTTFTPSPDGTSCTAPSGCTLRTKDGVWSWGPQSGSYYFAMLNGVPAGEVIGTQMVVNSNGQMFLNSNSGWEVFIEYLWQASAGGSSPGPIPIGFSVNPSFTGNASTCVLPCLSLAANPPVGSHLVSMSVTMSDGSAYSGSYAIYWSAGTQTLMTFSGNNIVTARLLTSADVANNSTQYNVQLVFGGNTWILQPGINVWVNP